MKSILLPTDFSPAADNAATYAVELARQLNSTINLAYVADQSLLAESEGGSLVYQGGANQVVTPSVRHLHQKLSLLSRCLQDKSEGKIGVDYLVRSGHPEEEIVNMSAIMDPALIIMGTRQEKEGFNRLDGSVTAHTIEHAKVPVLAIPQNVQFEPVKKILYASYFDSRDKDALLRILRMFYPEEIHLQVVYFFDDKGISFSKEIYRSIEQELKDHIAPNYQLANVDIEVVESSNAVEALNKMAEEESFQWMVSMTHKRTEMTRITDPSFTKELMFLAKTPLLAFHHS